jgi:hypothetical protein
VLVTALALLVCLVGVLLRPAVAAADGDPASDVLASQVLFLPSDAGLATDQLHELSGLLSEAARAGVSLRLAVIASPADLGSVTALWRQPQLYARFLDQELGLVFRGRLLVVMPNGLGMAGGGRPGVGEGAVAGPHVGAPGPALGRLAIGLVQRAAAADGHPLRPVAAGVGRSSGSGGDAPLIALALGAALIAVCWGASVMAQPLRVRRTGSQPPG